MKISLVTLTALKYSGDKNAEAAYNMWLSLEEKQFVEDSKVECHSINNNQNFVLLLVKNKRKPY